MSKWTYFAVFSSTGIQGLFHKIQAMLLQIQWFQGVLKDLAVFQGVFQARMRANHVENIELGHHKMPSAMYSAEMQLIFDHWFVEVYERNYYLVIKKVLWIGGKRDP